MTIVHLLRHGEVHNPDRVLYGRLPGFRLSALGEQQAEIAAAFLAGRDIAYLVSSPLERARQTAAPLSRLLGLEIDTDDRLIEADNTFQGQVTKDIFRTPGNWRYLRNPFRPSWGEPYAQLAARVLAAARRAAVQAGQREAVCVSHQLPIVSVRRLAEGRRLFHDPRRRQCALGSVTSLHFDGEDVVGVDYAEPAGATPKDAVPGA